MEHGAAMPSHAYIPGQTKRHADTAFDTIRNSVRAGMTIAELERSAAFQTGLRYLEHGFYWEAHEVLEPVWMLLPPDRQERHFVQGCIQTANGFLKLRMAKPKAAQRLAAIAYTLFAQCSTPVVLGVERQQMVAKLADLNRHAMMQNNAHLPD